MATKVEVFTSPTCPHCPAAVQVVDEAKAKLGDAIDVELKSIADEEGRQAAINYGIMAVPAIAINNEIQFIGAPSLEELLEKCKKHDITLILSHVNEQPMSVMQKANFIEHVGKENFCAHIDDALKRAEELSKN